MNKYYKIIQEKLLSILINFLNNIICKQMKTLNFFFFQYYNIVEINNYKSNSRNFDIIISIFIVKEYTCRVILRVN